MLYNIYKTNGNAPLGITDWEHLRVMRLDFTERDIYNHRYVKTDSSIKHLFKKRASNAQLKKIGFVSRDFAPHRPNGQLAIRFFSILSKYSEFSLHFYSLQSHPVDHKLFDTYGTVKKASDYNKLANVIADDDIDILIDMQGFMVNNFTELLLQKPAPIQIHWLGYPGTLGLSTIDYLVADDIIIPDTSQKYYREKIAYIPHLYQSNNPDFIQSKNYVLREFYEIPQDVFVFTHFNSDYKVDRKIWFEWMDILKRTPKSLLVFTVLTSGENDTFIKQLMHDAALCGVGDKIKYLKQAPRHQHFNRLQLFNLGLDTYRINGHTTNADLVCAGIPFITYTSDTYHNRVGKSILHELDLDELVCNSYDEYKDKAIALATNPEYYASVKAKVVENRTKVMFNTYHYTRSFVNMIFSIWDAYHIREEERKEANHFFVNENTNELEKKIVPFEPIRLGKFNNHYIGIPKTKWVFYENKTLPDSCEPFIISKKRKQYLRDYVNLNDECLAFTTNGKLYDVCDTSLVDMDDESKSYGEAKGIWVRELIPEEEQQPDVNTTLNKDYQLPKITMVFFVKKSMNLSEYISKISSYFYTQRYINAELIIVSEHENLDPNGKKFLFENINFITFINITKETKDINTVLIENSSSTIIIEVKEEHFNDLFYIQNFYEKNIASKITNQKPKTKK